jgi:hypothetical protein
MKTFQTIDNASLNNVTGGQGTCADLVNDTVSLIHTAYANDPADYRAERLRSYAPALAEMQRNCNARQAADGDAPVNSPVAPIGRRPSPSASFKARR